MSVREADGDSRSYFRESYENDPATKSPQRPFSIMADWVLEETVAKAAEWQDGRVPDGFDPMNSWGGEHAARECARTNAENAQRELDARRLPTPPKEMT